MARENNSQKSNSKRANQMGNPKNGQKGGKQPSGRKVGRGLQEAQRGKQDGARVH